jgi:DNA (cytosine-5)-methyltransferase 1
MIIYNDMPIIRNKTIKTIKFIDLFCGIGGFRIAAAHAAETAGARTSCVFSCDIDENCQTVYEANFGERPAGDLTAISGMNLPDHDLLLAGFPCQPFSIIGHRKGFEDTRGTLFFDIARILEAKKPSAFLLENVKLLAGHNGGRTLSRIMKALKELGYKTDCRALNAMEFGLPQKRERIFIVGFRHPASFEWPKGEEAMKPLAEILEADVDKKYYASDYIVNNRLRKHSAGLNPSIWHENKSGHISSYPYSCALRAGASHNYLLVNGERRLTPREMLRLQGFPDSFRIAGSYSQIRKQAGNSLPVPVAAAILKNMFAAMGWYKR